MKTVDWTEVYASNTLEEAVDIFTSKFRHVLNFQICGRKQQKNLH